MTQRCATSGAGMAASHHIPQSAIFTTTINLFPVIGWFGGLASRSNERMVFSLISNPLEAGNLLSSPPDMRLTFPEA